MPSWACATSLSLLLVIPYPDGIGARHKTRRVYCFRCGDRGVAHGHDPLTLDRNVPLKGRCAGAVYDGRAFDQYVVMIRQGKPPILLID